MKAWAVASAERDEASKVVKAAKRVAADMHAACAELIDEQVTKLAETLSGVAGERDAIEVALLEWRHDMRLILKRKYEAYVDTMPDLCAGPREQKK